MFTDRDLHDLLNYSSSEPVLNVYLNTDATEGNAEAQRLRLRSLLKGVNLPEEEAAVIQYFEHERDWTGRSVAIFSCARNDYFKAYPLGVPLRSMVWVSNQPYVKPLADLLDSYGGYGVALVDKQGARLFGFHLGELQEQEGILGEDIRHVKRGGASSVPGRRGGSSGHQRASNEAIERNLKDAADFAAKFFHDNHIRRVLIGGTDENIAQFRQYLSKTWQSLVVGTFAMSMTANSADVLAKAMAVGKEAEIRRENRLVEEAITAAAKGAGGVVRLDDTLTAVHEGRVQTLIIQEGLRLAGYRCQGCEYVTSQPLEACPFCGKGFNRIEDAVELVVRKVMQSGGEVEVVRDNPDLGKVGVAGLLRY